MLKNLTYIGIFTFAIILSWIGFGIYHSYVTSTIENDTQILINPIPAHFDLDVVKSISARNVINVDLASNSPAATSSASAKPSPSPTPSPKPAQITPTISPLPTQPQSSQSANIQL